MSSEDRNTPAQKPTGAAFVCHSSEDGAFALSVAQQLEANGVLRCWIAPRDVPFGVEYPTALVDAIASCDIFLLLLSKRSNASHMVHREVERAASRKKPVYTVRIEDVVISKELEIFVSTPQRIDALGCDASQVAERIARALSGKRASLRPSRGVMWIAVAAALVATCAGGALLRTRPGPSRSHPAYWPPPHRR
jgi:TIR domain-containing protein